MLSIVVVIYNMAREVPRTLQSLSPGYQLDIDPKSYELIVVDNGSTAPLGPEILGQYPGQLRYLYISPDQASPSPAHAVNVGVRRAGGDQVGIFIDGARLASPRLLSYAQRAFLAFRDPIVTALAWHIGPDVHRRAVRDHGYSRETEDRLLQQIQWPKNGYRLFEVSALAGSSAQGWFSPKWESSSLFMSRRDFDRLGGFDERFDEPGGGLGNVDFYIRACELSATELVAVLGEGTFHQMHGGAMTGADEETARRNLERWRAQYVALRGEPPQAPGKKPHFIGHMPAEALGWAKRSVQTALGEG